jgi:predicted transcriptional regulator
VKQWIGLDQLVKDMELELMTIFPKERENRILSVKLLKRLMESGPLTQSEVAEEVFDGAEMKASRVLGRLESWNYIKRERRGKDKIVSLL